MGNLIFHAFIEPAMKGGIASKKNHHNCFKESSGQNENAWMSADSLKMQLNNEQKHCRNLPFRVAHQIPDPKSNRDGLE